MALTDRELWAVAGGLVLGLLLLLAITGSLAAIWTLRQRFVDGDAAMEFIPPVTGGVRVDPDRVPYVSGWSQVDLI